MKAKTVYVSDEDTAFYKMLKESEELSAVEKICGITGLAEKLEFSKNVKGAGELRSQLICMKRIKGRNVRLAKYCFLEISVNRSGVLITVYYDDSGFFKERNRYHVADGKVVNDCKWWDVYDSVDDFIMNWKENWILSEAPSSEKKRLRKKLFRNKEE